MSILTTTVDNYEMSRRDVFTAVSDEEFAHILECIGGFEVVPCIGVAVSGGCDSMALLLLCYRWVWRRGGRVIGMTVNHRLRVHADQDIQTVKRWLEVLGIEHVSLVWEGGYGVKSGIQEAAREARYRLLVEACEGLGILHLFLGHHRTDQAETLLQRLSKGSGVVGLSAMLPVRELGHVRLIRPLLGMTKERLGMTCRAAGQDWIEDPYNYNVAFSRVQLRQAAPTLQSLGLTSSVVSLSVRRLGWARQALERHLATVVTHTVTLYPEGYLLLDTTDLLKYPREVVLLLLERCLTVIGGSLYPPRRSQIERLYTVLQSPKFSGCTLGGCRLLRSKGKRYWLLREYAAIRDVQTLYFGQSVVWDGRFLCSLRTDESRKTFVLSKLGYYKDSQIRCPKCVVPTLPALWYDHSPVHIAYCNQSLLDVSFVPLQPLTRISYEGLTRLP